MNVNRTGEQIGKLTLLRKVTTKSAKGNVVTGYLTRCTCGVEDIYPIHTISGWCVNDNAACYACRQSELTVRSKRKHGTTSASPYPPALVIECQSRYNALRSLGITMTEKELKDVDHDTDEESN